VLTDRLKKIIIKYWENKQCDTLWNFQRIDMFMLKWYLHLMRNWILVNFVFFQWNLLKFNTPNCTEHIIYLRWFSLRNLIGLESHFQENFHISQSNMYFTHMVALYIFHEFKINVKIVSMLVHFMTMTAWCYCVGDLSQIQRIKEQNPF
jgi:hypothetical protein